MRGPLTLGGYLLATVSSSYLLLGKWIVRPAPKPAVPLGFVQAFHLCPACGTTQPHLIHSSVCRRCLTCRHLTTPGDPQ